MHRVDEGKSAHRMRQLNRSPKVVDCAQGVTAGAKCHHFGFL